MYINEKIQEKEETGREELTDLHRKMLIRDMWKWNKIHGDDRNYRRN